MTVKVVGKESEQGSEGDFLPSADEMQCTQRNVLSLGLKNLRRSLQSSSFGGGGGSLTLAPTLATSYQPPTHSKPSPVKQWQNVATFSTSIHQAPYSTAPAAAAQAKAQTQALPKLPVPPLNDTLAKYLRTVKPLLTDEEFEKTTELVKEFGTNPNLGPKLQSLLEQRATQKDNWLADWWLSAAYLGYRQPVIVHSSPGLIFPFADIKSKEEQLNYTARLIHAALQFKSDIEKGGIQQEFMGKVPLDMSQYNNIIGVNRAPAVPEDILTYNPQSRHIVVAYKNYFHKLEVIDGNGNIADPSEILKQLLNVCVLCSGLNGYPFGMLTGEPRDSWVQTYQRLQRDSANKESIKVIEESLFLVCIDKPNRPVNVHRTRAVTAIPDVEDLEHTERLTAAGLQMLHGYYTNAGNRWHDKTIQFVVGQEGEVGLTYEHSPADGPPIAAMMDYIVTYLKNNSNPVNLGQDTAGPKTPPVQLPFNLKDKKITKAISEAKGNVDAMIKDLDLSCFSFKTYGKEFIKSCKFSPDSYIQMAIQAAYFKVHKAPAPHYESASTRMFHRGRTETIRSCLMDALEFSRGIENPGLSLFDKFKLMKKAIEAHKEYTNEAVRGLGVDRHLLGLKKIAAENGMEVPALFLDPGYINSTHFKLSTSQVASAYNGLMCYGPVVPDGYGCCYNPLKDEIIFGVSAFNSNTDTDSNNFKSSLQEILLDMQVIGHANVSKL